MSTISVPEELYKKASELAEAQQMSVDEIFASALAEHLAAWERLRQCASRGDRAKFTAVLDRAPDMEAEDFD